MISMRIINEMAQRQAIPGPSPSDPDFVEPGIAGENEAEFRAGILHLEEARAYLLGGASRELSPSNPNVKALMRIAKMLNEAVGMCNRLGPKIWADW